MTKAVYKSFPDHISSSPSIRMSSKGFMALSLGYFLILIHRRIAGAWNLGPNALTTTQRH
jgi:hypothetical protein